MKKLLIVLSSLCVLSIYPMKKGKKHEPKREFSEEEIKRKFNNPVFRYQHKVTCQHCYHKEDITLRSDQATYTHRCEECGKYTIIWVDDVCGYTHIREKRVD